MNDEAASWMSFAETDIGVARYPFDNYQPQPHEIICYHCQQAAETLIQ